MKLSNTLTIILFVAFFSSVSMAQHHNKRDTTNAKKMIMHENNMDSTKTETAKVWNKVCPVMGEEVDEEAPTFEYKGKNYGFCCPGCDKKFKKDPEKYIKNLSEDGTKFLGK